MVGSTREHDSDSARLTIALLSVLFLLGVFFSHCLYFHVYINLIAANSDFIKLTSPFFDYINSVAPLDKENLD